MRVLFIWGSVRVLIWDVQHGVFGFAVLVLRFFHVGYMGFCMGEFSAREFGVGGGVFLLAGSISTRSIGEMIVETRRL